MSQPSAPADVQPQTNPVETQEPSAGQVPPAFVQSQAVHEAAMRDDTPDQSVLNAAVAQAIQDQFAVTDAWKPKMVFKFVIHCPSGQTALVKHLDTMDLLRANLIEELDFFTKKLNPAPNSEEDTSLWTVLHDPEKRCRFLDLMNRLMGAASIKPKIVNDGVALITNEQGEQEEIFGHQVAGIDRQIELFGKPVPRLKDGEAYAGTIDFPDRMAFFTELNKPLAMLEPFRDGQTEGARHMAPSEDVGSST